MENYIVRFALDSDIPAIMDFIGTEWKQGHILSYDKNFFKWQYINDKLDYVIGLDCKHKIQGMLAFISYSYSDKRDIATSMWKAKNGTSFLGMKMLMYIMKCQPHRVLFSPGINVKTSAHIYHRMGILTGTMRQWYRLRDLSNYKIADVKSKGIPLYSEEQAELVQYRTFDELLSAFDYDRYVTKEQIPYKSKAYFEKRYYRHPSYQYLVYGIRHNDGVRASVVLRIQECNGARAIRFVDCIGDYLQIGLATAGLDSLLEQFDAEYIDLYEAGLSEDMLSVAGWLKVKETNNIIPNYFSPFEQRVVDIHYCTSNPDIVLFRGDGDQDRPN